MPYVFIKDVVADIGVEIKANSLTNLFSDIVRSFYSILAQRSTASAKVKSLRVKIKAGSLEELVFKFFDELIFIKDTKGLISQSLAQCEVVVNKKAKDKYCLDVELNCIKAENIVSRVDIKAVSLHRFSVKQTQNGYKAVIVFDI
ncbi:MAG: protein archease [Patescibacteria group bacterium]|nr:MAG: protein archease [Patescibacteria group bacterium]